ncbi:MAG: oligosaccharide flippase family protein [Fuerstiella sp.]|nr:oligosaccharide flippase family protein [Fuerstiella sp.]MCP4854074.1 oligosaccharide flippase family protein [Fuerstiella sp.]
MLLPAARHDEGMMKANEFVKHSTIYGIGQVLTRLASVLLLPLYTAALTPEQYGITAILNLGGALLALLLADGVANTIVRFHFDDEDSVQLDRVWWTGLAYITVATIITTGPMLLFRDQLGVMACGDFISASEAGYLVVLALLKTWFGTIQNLLSVYLRVQKRSMLFVSIAMCRLLISIGLNVYFLLSLKMGPAGLLLSALIVTALNAIVLMGIFLAERGRCRFDGALLTGMLRYGAPLILSGLALMLMHEADRYLLRLYGTMQQVGLYSFAHRIGFAVHALCLVPFISVWQVSIFDIARQPDSNATFRRAFDWFVSGMGILYLGASLTVHPVLPWLTPESYGAAAELIPVILLGCFIFGLSFHFDVPALLARRTLLVIPASIAGVIVNVSGNILLIPLMGARGAAWMGVLTYAAFSGIILAYCRRAVVIPYRWGLNALKLAGFCGTYVTARFFCFPTMAPVAQIALSVALCCMWAVTLFGRDAIAWWVARRQSPVRDAFTIPDRDIQSLAPVASEPEYVSV